MPVLLLWTKVLNISINASSNISVISLLILCIIKCTSMQLTDKCVQPSRAFLSTIRIRTPTITNVFNPLGADLGKALSKVFTTVFTTEELEYLTFLHLLSSRRARKRNTTSLTSPGFKASSSTEMLVTPDAFLPLSKCHLLFIPFFFIWKLTLKQFLQKWPWLRTTGAWPTLKWKDLCLIFQVLLSSLIFYIYANTETYYKLEIQQVTLLYEVSPFCNMSWRLTPSFIT